jgi:hypothetical protein
MAITALATNLPPESIGCNDEAGKEKSNVVQPITPTHTQPLKRTQTDSWASVETLPSPPEIPSCPTFYNHSDFTDKIRHLCDTECQHSLAHPPHLPVIDGRGARHIYYERPARPQALQPSSCQRGVSQGCDLSHHDGGHGAHRPSVRRMFGLSNFTPNVGFPASRSAHHGYTRLSANDLCRNFYYFIAVGIREAYVIFRFREVRYISVSFIASYRNPP